MSSEIAIKVQNLSKKYTLRHSKIVVEGNNVSEHWALNNVSFEIKKGDSVGIIGPNGSGKSTLLKILSGVTKPTSGLVEITGRVASILDIGTGFQMELSGKDNVFLNGQLLGFSYKEIKLRYDEIVKFSGIGSFIEEPVKTYSNGMYLRLAFSILAHLDFDIYLFDEVMSVGDASFQIKVKSILESKRKDNHSTFVFVSHQLAEVQSKCTGIYLLNNGVISKDNFGDLLDNYMSASFNESDLNLPADEVSFNDDVIAPNEYYQLKKVYARPSVKSSGIFFCAELHMISACNIDVSFSVENLIGNELFYVSTIVEKTLQVNESEINKTSIIKVEVPDNVLVGGKYVLCITLLANKKTMVNRHKSCTFQFSKTGSELLDGRPNVPLIPGNWSVTQQQ